MRNRFGLLNTDLELIIKTLIRQPKVRSASIFGSRAKGNYNTGSDVDIALKGNELDFETLNQLSYWLNEETAMPYKFDLLNYDSIKEPELKDHIDRAGIEFYNSSSISGTKTHRTVSHK
jgi:uncharacterized protein